MPRRFTMRTVFFSLVVLCLVSIATLTFAQTETILHQFQATTSQDGSVPYSGLLVGKKGQLFGNGYFGGNSNNGVVFELTPPSSSGGSWHYSILYNFGPAPDGANPRGTLVADRKGNLYGTTQDGGTFACGTVFELSPPIAKGQPWTESILYSFDCAHGDGSSPSAGVIFDSVGNLYGTAFNGGVYSYGAVFKLSPPTSAGGPWTEAFVYSFQHSDGDGPFGGLVYGGHNIYYGFTSYGGNADRGVFFQITATGKESVIHQFQDRQDGAAPSMTPLIDSAGNIYGAANIGGTTGNGVVFEFTPPAVSGHWTENILYNFNGTDGSSCQGLVFDSTGILYGTTWGGGTSGMGTVFKLTPPTSGGFWTEEVLHNFTGSTSDGSFVWTSPALVNGTLYGVTHTGGSAGDGVVFAVTP